MKNTVKIWNFKFFILLLIAIIIAFGAMVGFVIGTADMEIIDKNLNGKFHCIYGKVSDVDSEENTIVVNGEILNCNLIEDYGVDIATLDGDILAFYVPKEHSGETLPWIIGISRGDTYIVDYKHVIANEIAIRTPKMITAFSVGGVLCAIMLIIIIVALCMKNKKKDVDILYEFARYSALKLPPSPQRKKYLLAEIIIVFVGYALLLAVCMVGMGTVDFSKNIVSTSFIAVSVVTGVFVVACAIVLPILHVKIRIKDIEYYAKEYPFKPYNFVKKVYIVSPSFKPYFYTGMNNISLPNHRHAFVDASAMFVIFEDDGISIKIDNTISREKYAKSHRLPSANIKGVGAMNTYKFPYDMLDFEAYVYYEKHTRPLNVLIHSNIDSNRAPIDMVNDIVLMLDEDLLKELNRYHVEVRNLAFILENKKELMEKNCTKRRAIRIETFDRWIL